MKVSRFLLPNSHAIRLWVFVIALAVSLAALQVPATADSDVSAKAVAQRVAAGAERSGSSTAAHNDEVGIPSDGQGEVTVTENDRTVTVGVPGNGAGAAAGDGLTTVFEGSKAGSGVAVQPTDEGVRAAIDIRSANAPEAYGFTFGGLATGLRLNGNGSVDVLGAAGESLGVVDTPWALDASGAVVPTHFEVDGSTLTQVIEHHGGDWAYGIVADPSFWWWTANIAKCTAGIATLFAGPAAATKLAKIKKIIASNKQLKKVVDKAGGIKKLMGKLASFVKKRGSVSAADKSTIKDLFKYGGAGLLSIVSGGCVNIVKQVF